MTVLLPDVRPKKGFFIGYGNPPRHRPFTGAKTASNI
jgi:hypothetical protein